MVRIDQPGTTEGEVGGSINGGVEAGAGEIPGWVLEGCFLPPVLGRQLHNSRSLEKGWADRGLLCFWPEQWSPVEPQTLLERGMEQ